MRYRNASEILPDKLLKEVQKYTSGEAIYIPQAKNRKKWGEGSGARKYYKERNAAIIEKYDSGIKIEELSKIYNLSIESIRKIIYNK